VASQGNPLAHTDPEPVAGTTFKITTIKIFDFVAEYGLAGFGAALRGLVR